MALAQKRTVEAHDDSQEIVDDLALRECEKDTGSGPKNEAEWRCRQESLWKCPLN